MVIAQSNTTKIADEQDIIRVSSVDLNKPHYPLTDDGSPWFKHTQSHFMTNLQLTPCARLLWEWVLLKAPAGTDVVVDLRDFRAVTAESHRGKPYSMRQIRNAVNQLEELDLLVIKYERLKMQARHPGKVTNVTKQQGNIAEKLISNSRKLTSNSQKLTSNSRKLTSTATAEKLDIKASRQSPDHTESLRSADQGDAAAAFKKVQEEKIIETTGNEVTQSGLQEVATTKVIESGLQEIPRQKEEIGQPSELTSDEPISAAQLETLKDGFKKLGINYAPVPQVVEVRNQTEEIGQASESTDEDQLSEKQLESFKVRLEKLGVDQNYAVKFQMQRAGADMVEKAIACFQYDVKTWTGKPIESFTALFRSVLRDLTEGRRKPLPGLNIETLEVDKFELCLNDWRNRYFAFPHSFWREEIRRAIAAEFPNGEIVVLDDQEGPVRGSE